MKRFSRFAKMVLAGSAVICGLDSTAFAGGAMQPIKEIFEPKGNFPTDKFVKVAVIQWAPPDAILTKSRAEASKIKTRNRKLLAEQIREAAGKGAEIIITSEMGVIGYPDIPGLPPEDMNFRTREEMEPYTETVPGPSSKFFAKLAQELNVTIQFGTAEVVGENFHNAAIAVSPTGEILAKHHKVSLFGPEHNYFTPGKSGTTYETPAGKFGMALCADIYNGTVLDSYLKNGVAAVALSTSWDQMNTGWGFFQSAAQQTKAYVLAANQPYFPDSGVMFPNGEAQSHIRQSIGIAYGYLPRVTLTGR